MLREDDTGDIAHSFQGIVWAAGTEKAARPDGPCDSWRSPILKGRDCTLRRGAYASRAHTQLSSSSRSPMGSAKIWRSRMQPITTKPSCYLFVRDTPHDSPPKLYCLAP